MATVSPLRLTDFDISEKTGFLMENPATTLPDEFEPWHILAKSTPEFMEKGTLRDEVHKMPVLDWSSLQTDAEKRLAHLRLCLISSGYVWQGGKDNVPQMLPASIAVPFWNLSQDLGIKPIFSHPGVYLANWQLKDTSIPISVDNVKGLYGFPGGEDMDQLIAITVTVEAQFVPALQCIVKGAYAVDIKDCEALTAALVDIRAALKPIMATFAQMHSLVRPAVLYNVLLPFITGWGGEGSVLPDGLIYEGVSDVPIKCISYSAAQTSTVASLDAFLDIQHKDGGRDYLLTRREYMPRGHRRFIETLEGRPSTREFVMESGNEELRTAYNECVAALIGFRNYHIQAVTKYVVVTGHKQKSPEERKSNSEQESDEKKLISFLKSMRTETKEYVISH